MSPQHVTRLLPLLAGLGSVGLSACTLAPPADDDRAARAALTAFRDGATRIPTPPPAASAGDFPEHPDPTAATIDSLRAYGFSDTASVIEFAAFGSGRRHVAGLTYQLGKPGHWAVAIIELRGNAPRIISIEVRPMSVSYRERNRFAVRLPPRETGLLVVAAFALLSLTTAWLVLRAPMPMPMRLLWCLIAFVGVGLFSVNWTTGESITKLVASHFLGVKVVRHGTAGPWLIDAVLPVGALVALFALRRARSRSLGRDFVPSRT